LLRICIRLQRDYRERAEEDFYDLENIDDAEYEDLDPEARRLVEAKLNRRDKELARRGGLSKPPAFLDSEDEPEFTLPTRRRRHYDSEPAYSMDGSEDMMDEEISAEALGDIK
jgi:DNA replication licensing factor MCM2